MKNLSKKRKLNDLINKVKKTLFRSGLDTSNKLDIIGRSPSRKGYGKGV